METSPQKSLRVSPEEEQQAEIAPPCDVPQDEDCPKETQATKTESDSNVSESQTDTRRLSEDSSAAGEGHEPAEETVESFITNENIYVVSISEEDVH